MDFGSGTEAEQAVLGQGSMEGDCLKALALRGILKRGSFNSLISVFLEGRISVKASCDETLKQDGRKVKSTVGEVILHQFPEEGLGKQHIL